ncbi:MAG: phosphoribosylamine--glycine ligase [Oscillospiraceae bacterium]|jgi:phosphoribosylamine--glycine ligase|nr:phosphoribosylamine--glycine ligase [Oscillospiraceae bacterium]
MKILLAGSGGREHAIADKLSQNKNITKIYCVPGNGGTASIPVCENIKLDTIEKIAGFAEEKGVDISIAGSEEFLVRGIADQFDRRGLKFFGPKSQAAVLEGSKAYAKAFMKKYGIRTAASETFTDSGEACAYLEKINTYPLVVKADGLAFGKGVVICPNEKSAKLTVREMIDGGAFGGAGKTVLIEQYLEGKEASVLSFCDGRTILPLLSAKDHKRAFDGDKGDNTGGMGAICPNPYVTEEVYQDFLENIAAPTLKGIQAEGLDFTGVIFFGLMITKGGIYLLEYNVRMGDPETQAVLPLMKSDLLALIESALNKNLADFKLEWRRGHSICVTVASGGYPRSYKKGFAISGLEKVQKYFIAGADFNARGEIVTTGGRVLNIAAVAENAEAAYKKVYKDVAGVHFEGAFYRHDIGL